MQESNDFGILFSQLGAALSLGLCAIGAAYGTSKSGVGLSEVISGRDNSAGEEKVGLIEKSSGLPKVQISLWKRFVPIIIAGVIAIYGLIIAVIITAKVNVTLAQGFRNLGAGLTMGLSGLASGMAIGTFGIKAIGAAYKDATFVIPMVLVLIFAEAIGLYGLIVALLTLSQTN